MAKDGIKISSTRSRRGLFRKEKGGTSSGRGIKEDMFRYAHVTKADQSIIHIGCRTWASTLITSTRLKLCFATYYSRLASFGFLEAVTPHIHVISEKSYLTFRGRSTSTHCPYTPPFLLL